MTRSAFHIASPQDIQQARTTDVYFVRALEVLKAKGLDRRVGLAELTVDALPQGWPWAVLCGVEEAASLLEGIPVDLKALPEGTLFPARDGNGVRVPVLTLEGPYGRFCLYETPLLGMICQATGVATKAARIRKLAGKAQVLAFGTRRMHPAIGPMLDRSSVIGGCDGVSNVLGAERIGQAARGTMPHALVIAFGQAEAAWAAFDEVIPKSVPRVALVDTYSDEKEEALAAAALLGKRLSGIRLDTPSSRRGNFPDLVREVRWELDVRGFRRVRILVSGGIDEEQIPALRQAGADGFGVGTAISNAPTVDFSLDLVEMEGRPCAKRSRLGGKKSVLACPRCLSYRVLPASGEPPALRADRPGGGRESRGSHRCPACRRSMESMLRPVLKAGRRVGKLPSVGMIRSTVMNQLRRRDG